MSLVIFFIIDLEGIKIYKTMTIQDLINYLLSIELSVTNVLLMLAILILGIQSVTAFVKKGDVLLIHIIIVIACVISFISIN